MSITKPIAILTLLAAVAVAGSAQPNPDPKESLRRLADEVRKAQPAANPDPRMPFFLECAEACGDCARSCDTCSAHCANMIAEGKKEHLQTLRTCQDCAAVCAAAARVVAKNGPFSDLICTACADACKRCGDACAKYPGDAIMKRCADECRKCEKACRDMLKGTVKKGETPQK